MKIYELDDVEFKDELIWQIYEGDAGRRFELHFTDVVYSMIGAFRNKLFPNIIEDLMLDRESHYKNVIRWMYGRGVDTGVSTLMQPSVGSWMHKNEVKFAGGIGHIDMRFNGMPYELKTSRYPYRKDLPWAHSIKQLTYYMAPHKEPEGRIKIFDMLPLDERTWAIELTKKDIKRKRTILKRKLTLLRTALLTGDWSILPETKLGFLGPSELDTIEFLEENKALIRRASKKWSSEFKVRQVA